STDKVDTEVPSPVAGTVVEIKVQEDEDVEVGEVLALVGSSDAAPAEEAPAPAAEPAAQEPEPEPEPAPEPKPAEKAEPAPQPTPAPAPAPAAEEAPTSPEETPRGDGYVTPLVRRLAREQNVDLEQVTGTGVGGRIRKQDVLAAAAAQEYEARDEKPAASAPAAPAQTASRPAPKDPESSIDPSKRGTTEKASRIRRVIADRMVESLDTSAQLTQVHEIDMTRIVNLRNQVKE